MRNQANSVPTILITGGYGCIGAETAKWLVHNTDAEIVVCGRRVTQERNQQVFSQISWDRCHFVEVDVTQPERLLQVLQEHEVTRVLHLAGLQTPDCNEHRDQGLQVNLAGTQHLVEAMKKSGRRFDRLVFASSLAVYGPRAHYPGSTVPMDAQPHPVNVYGIWKLAGEHVCRLYAEETGTPTISVRPGALFGPGRDVGLTASPTIAIQHVARGEAFEIPYRSRQDYLYVPDVAAAVGNTLIGPFKGYAPFTLPSHTVATADFVVALRQAAEELGVAEQFQITVGDAEVPFICDVSFEPFRSAFPNAPLTPFSQAVTLSLATFIQQERSPAS